MADMSWLGGAIAGTLGGVASLIQTGLNFQQADEQRFYNQRDFDYQKAIQQETWNREDNAVQRRMADLKAAGLNPNLANGSAASSGAIVGRSNTSAPSINVGNPVGVALDMASAVSQLRNLKEQNKILKNQARESSANAEKAEYDASMAGYDSLFNKAEFANLFGLKPSIKLIRGSDGSLNPELQWSNGSSPVTVNGKDYEIDISKSRFMDYLNWQYQNNKNSADLLQKDVDWYTADKIANYAGTAAQIFSGAGSGYRNFKYGGRK